MCAHIYSIGGGLGGNTNPTGASSHRRAPRIRIHHSIARDLGIQLVAGNLKPGDVLPIEVDANERLGVSRTAYREAISWGSAVR